MINPKSNGKICTSLTSTLVPLSLSLDIETVIRFREKFQFDVRGGVALLLAAEPTREWDREGTEREEGGDGGIIFQGLPSLCRVSPGIEACLL